MMISVSPGMVAVEDWATVASMTGNLISMDLILILAALSGSIIIIIIIIITIGLVILGILTVASMLTDHWRLTSSKQFMRGCM